MCVIILLYILLNILLYACPHTAIHGAIQARYFGITAKLNLIFALTFFQIAVCRMLTCADAYKGARFGVAVMLNLIFALIFFQIGDARKEGYDTYSPFGAVMYDRYSLLLTLTHSYMSTGTTCTLTLAQSCSPLFPPCSAPRSQVPVSYSEADARVRYS
jgi:hypothetical protein